MNALPDFSQYGYQVKKQLGRNDGGDYIGAALLRSASYLALHTPTQQPVVIKQYQFSKIASVEKGLSAYQSEIEGLKARSHPNIARYLDAFEIPNGFCLVRESINAQPLSSDRRFEPEQIKQIALSVLDILISLQTQTPPVIHGNLKPENVLVDDELNVYLIDFAIAAVGTVGFMPVEQFRNKKLTPSSDLYSLGATLTCLLTKTNSKNIEKLNDSEGRINFYAIIPTEFSQSFIEWLDKMMEAYPSQRYANAEAAREALDRIEMRRSPEVNLIPTHLEFQASEYGETLTASIKISNHIPDTLLQGNWQIAPHPNDLHDWISLKPANFETNKIECEIAIDTSQLIADTLYEREILLQANTSQKTHVITTQIKTAPVITQKMPRRALERVFAVALLGGAIASGLFNLFFWLQEWEIFQLIIGLVLGAIAGLGGAFGCVSIYVNITWILFVAWFGGYYSGSVSGWIFAMGFGLAFLVGYGTLIGYPIGFAVGAVSGHAIRYKFGKPLPEGINGLRAGLISSTGGITLLVATFGLSIGLLLKLGLNVWSLMAVAATGIPLRIMSDRIEAKQAKLKAQYRQSEPRLIKP